MAHSVDPDETAHNKCSVYPDETARYEPSHLDMHFTHICFEGKGMNMEEIHRTELQSRHDTQPSQSTRKGFILT